MKYIVKINPYGSKYLVFLESSDNDYPIEIDDDLFQRIKVAINIIG